MNNYNSLEISILKTIAYFDIFNYPLTLMEIYKWLYCPDRHYRLSEIQAILTADKLQAKIQNKFGFYFLNNREEIISIRLSRYSLAELKFHVALKATKFFCWLGFVKMIAVCNNAGYNNALVQSDIDFFIIIKNKRLWWSRLLITLLASIFKFRRHAKKVKDRVCLSFYLADDALDLTPITLGVNDIYLTYWLATLAPVYDKEMYQSFLSANNWLNKYLPNYYPVNLADRRKVYDSSFGQFFQTWDEKILSHRFGNYLEKLSKLFQQKKMHQHQIGNYPTGTEVVINDSMLKFHENDMRQKYFDAWQQKLKSLDL